MKKKSLLLVFLISLFMFIGSVSAEGNSIECGPLPLELKVDEAATCNITIAESGEYEITTTSGLTTSKTNITQTDSITVTATEIGRQTVTLKKVSDSSDAGISENINVSAKATTTKTTVKTTTKAKSSNSFLASITLDGEKIKNFSKSTQKYTTTVTSDIDSVALEATAADTAAKVDVDGPALLKTGENTYTITVTAEDETTKIYKVIIIKDEEESVVTKLKSIKITGYDIDFDGSSKTYYLKIKEGVTKLTIKAIAEDDKADVEITGNEDLKDGSIIKIVVSNDDNEKTTYRIIIEQKANEKSNALLYGIIAAVITFIVVGVIIFVRKKKNNNNDKSKKPVKKEINKEEVLEEKTKEVKKIEEPIEEEEELDFQEEIVDNDEEEKTRVLNFIGKLDDLEDLEKTKIADLDNMDLKDAINNLIDEENKED